MVLAKLTSENQLTLPEAVLEQAGGPADYYDVVCENGVIVLTPCHPGAGQAVRARLKGLGITEADVADAVAWARHWCRLCCLNVGRLLGSVRLGKRG